MGQGRLAATFVIVLAALVPAAAAAPALPAGLEFLAPSGDGSAPAGAAQDLAAAPLPTAGQDPQAPAKGVLAAIGEALGGLAGGLGALAGGLASAGGALASGLGSLLGALVDAVLWVAGSLGAALGALAAVVAGALGALLAGLAGALGAVAQATLRNPAPVASVGLGAAVLQLTGAWQPRLPAPLAALFSRLERHELLTNEARQRIYDHVRASPGAHVSQVAQAAGLGWGATVYHLQRLRDAQLLSARRVGNQLCHFVNGDARSAQEQTLLAATKQEKAHAIVALLERQGPTTQRDLAAALGLSSALMSFHAKRLEDLGVVQRFRTGRTTTLALKPALLAPAAAPARPAQAASAARPEGRPAAVVRKVPAEPRAPAPIAA